MRAHFRNHLGKCCYNGDFLMDNFAICHTFEPLYNDRFGEIGV